MATTNTKKTSTTYPHKIRSGKHKGQRCEILRNAGGVCQVRLEDGTTIVLDRRVVRRGEAAHE